MGLILNNKKIIFYILLSEIIYECVEKSTLVKKYIKPKFWE